MVEQRAKNGIRRLEKCPLCGADVELRFKENSYQLFNPDGAEHSCPTAREYDKHPIGQAVTGKTVQDYQLRGRRLTITFSDGSVLMVTAAGTPLTIGYNGPAGMMQE